MIDEYWTWELYGYHSDDISYGSLSYPVVAVCDECCRYRIVKFCDYRDMCRHCVKMVKYLSDTTRTLLSESHVGSTHSDETRLKMSASMTGIKHGPLSEERKREISESGKGRTVSDEARRKASATFQGIPYEEWNGFATEQKYCRNFNNDCRNRNRDKYDNACFMCGRQESENVSKTGKHKLLSVHHYDMNKDQGCNHHKWKLVPLCMYCHGTAHSEIWKCRIEYLLEYVWKL